MYNVKSSRVPFGIYLPDDGISFGSSNVRFNVVDKLQKYMPIWNEFKVGINSELILTDGVNQSNEITSYNGHDRNSSLSNSAKQKKRICVTHNDLMLGSTKHIFNFTKTNITISNDEGIVKTYVPLMNDKMNEYAGKIMIFEIIPFNTPEFITNSSGVDNYLELLYEKYYKTGSGTLLQTAKLYKFVKEQYEKTQLTNNGTAKSNTVKVVTLLDLPLAVVEDLKEKDIFVAQYKIVISAKNVNKIPLNPVSLLNGASHGEINKISKENSMLVYINDPDKEIGTRYVSFMGKVLPVPVTKSIHKQNGLFICFNYTDEDREEHVCDIEGIRVHPHLYKTKEEAATGGDINELFKAETERFKLEAEREKVAFQNELAAINRDKEIQATEMKEKLNNLHNEKEYSMLEMKERLVKLQMEKEMLAIELQERNHALKLELEEMKAKSTIVQHEAKTEREVNTTNHSERKNELDASREVFKMLMENKKYDMENSSMRRKNYYEEQRYERDNTLETLKTVAAVAGVAATGFLIYKKLS